jgi:hypothetical protein
MDATPLLLLGALLVLGSLVPRGAALRGRVAAVLLGLLVACGPRAEAVAADTIAQAADETSTALAETYALRGEALVSSARSRDEALSLLADHRARWRPVWEAIDALAAAHDAWATGLEAGRSSPEAVAALRAAACDVAAAARGVDASPGKLASMCGGAP